MTGSEWGDCPKCGTPLMTWNSIMEMGAALPVQIIVRCPNDECAYEEVRTGPAGAKEDLKALLKELEP